jgi:hypothetical protein
LSKDTATESIVRDYLLEQGLKLKTSNKASIDKRVAVSTASDLLVIDQLHQSLSKVFHKGWACPPKYKGKRLHAPHKRIVNILLSDLHFGSKLDPDECPIEYNVIQESRRLGRVAQQVADYKTEYRRESKLIIHLLGDIIQNHLFDPRDGEPLSLQFAAAVHYLVQLILFLSSQYPYVEIYCTSGNHGRDKARHQDRAVCQKFDSIETMIYVAVKTAILNSGISNCKFFIPKTPYYICQMFDSKGLLTHGDTVLRPGYPGRNINVNGLMQQVLKWNSARGIGGPFQLYAVGHVHFGSITNLPGGIHMITNGCLVPPDSYALSIGAPDVTCGQYLFESVAGHVVGDQRFIVVDGAEKDSSYNSIISPFEGF